jgi:hypothetical protein
LIDSGTRGTKESADCCASGGVHADGALDTAPDILLDTAPDTAPDTGVERAVDNQTGLKNLIGPFIFTMDKNSLMGKNRIPRRGEVIEAVSTSVTAERRVPQDAEKSIFAAFGMRRTNIDSFASWTLDAGRIDPFSLASFFLHLRSISSDATTPTTLTRGSV